VVRASPRVRVRVSGAYACFTRPEFKTERISYDVMTPSAARGILESIFWRPRFRWQVQAIAVCRPIRRVALTRNELTQRQSVATSRRRSTGPSGHRQQRTSVILKDVLYVIEARMVLNGALDYEAGVGFTAQFERRLRRGQCFTQPYLGCREFWAQVGPCDGTEQPCAISDDLGWMIQDIDYEEQPAGPLSWWIHRADQKQLVRGYARPRFFRARLDRGVLVIPQPAWLEEA
jgi:CRISPR-associated protein Cas5d